MSSKVSSKKVKKPLDLPLGKASIQKEIDLSHVRLPIDTSIFGLKHILTLFETATNEVKNYLSYECNIMYECRLCRTIFRSLANFILHKRKYCRDKYNCSEDPCQPNPETDGVSIIHRDIQEANKIIFETEEISREKTSRRNLNPIIEKLLKKQEHKKFVEDIKNESLPKSEKVSEKKSERINNILLENIDASDVAVFQTAALQSDLGSEEFMKSEVMEIHSLFDKNEAVIGSDGKVLSFSTDKKEEKASPKNTTACTECDLKFSTKKTLAYHIRYKHNKSRLVYPCPECKETLANAWSVYRHLLKVHRKTSSQIRKYRNQIHNSAICRRLEELPMRMRKNLRDSKEDNDEENEWLDNVEGDNDLQMCGGCGKRFERKAALISHAVMCTKRIAICNSIKEHNAKKKEADEKESKLKSKTAIMHKPQIIGSAKRKPETLITYKPKTDSSSAVIPDKIEEELEEPRSDSDVFIKVEFSKLISDNVETITSEEDESGSETDPLRNNVGNEIDEEKVLSIQGVDSSSSEHSESPSKSSEDNFSSKLSDRSDSPCKGFENSQPSRIPELIHILSSNEVSENASETRENLISPLSEVERLKCNENIEDLVEVEVDLSNSSGHEDNDTAHGEPDVREETTDITSRISLNNNNSNEIISELNISEEKDDDSQNVSINSMIKNVIDQQQCDTKLKSFDEEIEVTKDNEIVQNEFITIEVYNEPTTPIKDINSDTETASSGKRSNSTSDSINSINSECGTQNSNVECVKRNLVIKRKKTKSPYNVFKKKRVVQCRSESDEAVTETEDETFISKITPFTDMPNLSCSLCSSHFNSLSHLLLHMSIHFSWYRYQCSKCPFMSYNRYDCESHVHKEHQLPFYKMQNTVLPIPTWKTASISDSMVDLEPINESEECIVTEENIPEEFNTESLNNEESIVDNELKPMHCVSNDNQRKEMIVGFIDLTNDTDELSDDNSEPEISNDINNKKENSDTSLLTELLMNSKEEVSTDMSKQAILEVILGDESKKKKDGNKDAQVFNTVYVRPPRNRVKSIKTSQKDFIYDLNIVRTKSVKGSSIIPKQLKRAENKDDNVV